uniref:carbohydrate binding domain-containing protein n=1 Tax=Radiobacillus sp. PE A8.2 TaxID=3380349 RepID=UPI00388EC45B
MKKFFILLMVILLIMPIVTYAEVGETSTTTQTAGVTELTNGSFETDENEDNCPDGWECSVDGDGTYDILTNPVHKGAQSFMTYDNNTDGYNIIEQAEVAVTPGITYMTSVWHRTNNVSDSPYIQLIFRDANGDQIQEEILYADANLNPTHDWKEISGKVTAPSGAATVDFRLAQDGVSGSIYWDSASIKDVGNVMFNGGFENNTDQWTSNGVGSVTTDDSDSAEGVRSIKLSASTDEEVVVEQNGAVNGGVWYRFQGSAKTDNGDAVLKVQWMDASDNIIDEESVIASSSEWDEIAKDIQSPFEAVKVNVQVTHQGTGSTWWDMVNVEQLPEIEDFGSQAFTLHTNNAAFDGHYAYTVTTLGYNFGKIDLNDGSLDALLQANSNSLGTMMHSNGKVYLTSNGVQVYDPDTEKISNLNLPTDCRRLNSLFELSDGKLWGTCYNPSNLFTYDPVTEEFKILDEIDEGRSYLWDVIEYKDKIFLSLGSPGALYVYDPETGVKERILQDLEESKHIRSIKLYGDRLFVKRVNPTDAIVIDADTYEQVEHLENVNGDLAEPDAQNRVLFTYNGDLNYFDLDDDSVGIVDSPHYFPNSGVIGKVRLDDQVNYPGESYAGIQNGGSIFVWNPETDAYKTIEIPMPSAASKTYQLTVGGDGSVYGVGVQGAGSFRVNPDDPLNTEAFDGPGQAEGMAAVGDYIYFGNYPSAVFYRQHVNEPWDPETIFDLGETKQNRPVAMKSYNGKIYIGAIADRGHLAGSFAIYDPATEEVKEYNGLSPDQSITSLAIKGDYAYLGTTIHGGLSSSPVTDEGKLVVFNMDTEQVEETIVPLEGNEVVSALTIGPDGNVWGIGGGDLFVYDTNTKEVTTQTLYDDVGQSHSWGVYGSMLLAQDGNVYGSAGNRLFRLDADKNLTTLFQSANVRRVVEDHQGRIWFSGGPDQTLMRYNTVATSAEEADTTALSEVISTATSLVEGAVVGDEVGQYPQAAVDALETVIAEAEAVLEDDNANQSTVDAAVSTVNTAIDAFNASVILEYPVILPDITIEGVEDGQNYQDPVTPVVSAQVGDIDISKFTAESDTIYVKFEDSTVEDGFGAQLGNLKVFKDNEAIIEFDVGSTTEAEYMFEDDSGDLNGKGRRFVNKDSYWSYKLTGVSDAQSLLLDVNNEYKISIATDEAGPYEIVAYNESNRFDSGINSLEVWVDGEPWTEGTAIEGDGPHTLVAKATSNAGHTATKTIDFTIGEVVEPSVNYLTNPSFEVGEDGVCPEGWGCTSYGSGGVISRDSTVIKDGEWSLKMEDTDTSSGQLVNQTLSLEGGKQYTISGWYKTEAIESKGYVYVFYFDENGNQITNEQLYIDKLGTNDWEAFTLQTSVAPKGTTSIKFNFSMWATPGTIWWDQLSITDAGLSQSIDHANEVLSTADIGDAVGQYPQAAADVLETAITAAEAAVGSEQATVDQAIVTLKKAVEAFYASINEVQRTALEQALTDADAVVAEAEIGDDPGQYPLSAVLAIQSAIEDAEAVLTDDSIENTIEGQETIDQAATILNQALATFEAAAIAGDVDTTALSSAITEANDKVSSAVVGEEVDEYPQTAVDALEAAIAAAESVLADNEADQDQVDAAVTTLNEAVTTFEAAVIKEEDDPSIPDPNAEILVTVKA